MNMMRLSSIFIVIFLLTACQKKNPSQITVVSNVVKDSGIYKIFPVDQSTKDPSLVLFLRELKKIIGSCDSTGLYKLFHPEIKITMGGELKGLKGFRYQFVKDHKITPDFWENFDKMLSLGGAFFTPIQSAEISYIVPYPCVDSLIPASLRGHPDFDIVLSGVCISPNSPVFEKPDRGSRVIAHLDYDIFSFANDSLNTFSTYEQFQYGETFDHKTKGFILKKDIYYLGGLYAVFKKISGKWIITEIIYGSD
jgi:hypothetical protein